MAGEQGGFSKTPHLYKPLYHDISSNLHRIDQPLGQMSSNCSLPSGRHEIFKLADPDVLSA